MREVQETSRLQFSRLTKADFDFVFSLESDPLVARYTPLKGQNTFRESRARFDEHLRLQSSRYPLGVWILREKEGCPVGWIMALIIDRVYPEVGIMLHRDYWGKGLAKEAIFRLSTYIMNELGYECVVAKIDHQNTQSIKLFEKLGFKKVLERQDIKVFELQRS